MPRFVWYPLIFLFHQLKRGLATLKTEFLFRESSTKEQ